jgi:hypothetical protein
MTSLRQGFPQFTVGSESCRSWNADLRFGSGQVQFKVQGTLRTGTWGSVQRSGGGERVRRCNLDAWLQTLPTTKPRFQVWAG